jgi:hypothetical protein
MTREKSTQDDNGVNKKSTFSFLKLFLGRTTVELKLQILPPQCR